MKSKLITILCLTLISNISLAEYFSPCRWTNASGDQNYHNSLNWIADLDSSNTVPANGGGFEYDTYVEYNGAGPISTQDTTVNVVHIGGWELNPTHNCEFSIDDGNFTVIWWFVVGEAYDSNGTINIAGGSLYVGTDLMIGAHHGGGGTLNLHSGSINTNNLFGAFLDGNQPAEDKSYGIINLYGGTIEIRNPNGGLFLNSHSSLNITKGILAQTGDHRKSFTEMTNNNWIKAYDGNGTVIVNYDEASDKTTLRASRNKYQNYTNPLDVKTADVFVLKHSDTYYLYGTSSNEYDDYSDGIPIWSSKNLVNWTYKGCAIKAGAGVWGQKWFWGPHVIEKNGTFYLYYNAYNEDDGLKGRICVATSTSPTGVFTDVAAPMFTPPTIDAIDPSVFIDDDGKAYLYYANVVNDGGSHEHQIYAAQMNTNLTSLKYTPFKMIEPSASWESNINEAPLVLKHNDTYYLTYSGNGYLDNYGVGYATAQTPLGPWTKYSGNPILEESGATICPGGQCFVDSPDGCESFIIYHRLIHRGVNYRDLAMDRYSFESNGSAPDKIVIAGASTIPQKYPSGSNFTKTATSDEFNGTSLDFDRWNSIWSQSRTNYPLSVGWLNLQLSRGDIWQENADAENIFLQLAPEGNFIITTRVNLAARENFEQAFLTIWQDSDNYISVKKAYIDGQRFTATKETQSIYQDISVHTNHIGDVAYLKIEKTGVNTYRCYYGSNGTNWTNIGGTITANFNEMKVGFGATLVYSSRIGTNAAFDFFRIQRDSPLADVNDEGNVDLIDFGIIDYDYNSSDSTIKLTGDLNENGICNIADLLILSQEWLN